MTTKNKKIAVGFTLMPLLLLFLWVSSSTLFAQSSSPGSTLSTPHPYGVKFSAGIFDMQISDVDLDAWPEIEAENQFNDPPAEGRRFVMWTLSVENARGSPNESERAFYLDFSAVVSGVLYETFSSAANCGVIPDTLRSELFLGGRTTGNICLSVPKDDSNLTLMYEADHTDGDGNDIDVEVWFGGLFGEWRGLAITPENRCSGYDRNDYDYPASVEDDIVDALDGIIYGPYTGTHFPNTASTTIEHIVALSEAHDSGLCSADVATRETFARDLANLTLASRSVNSSKGGRDASEWLPDFNQCWYADRVVKVRQKYSLAIDQAEVDALEAVLQGCTSFEMVVLDPGTSDEFHPCDTNRNGRIDREEVIEVIALYLFG